MELHKAWVMDVATDMHDTLGRMIENETVDEDFILKYTYNYERLVRGYAKAKESYEALTQLDD